MITPASSIGHRDAGQARDDGLFASELLKGAEENQVQVVPAS
jgi:hypothetical protein